MSLKKRLEIIIGEEARKLADKHHSYHNVLELEHQRKLERLKVVPAKEIKTPIYWGKDVLFNPFHVLPRRRQIALSISKKIAAGCYEPHTPEVRTIPKPSGGTRVVTVYQIPDAAVSRMFYQQLLRKNRHRFSSSAYAYRNDRNVHFAIQDIAVELSRNTRVFIAEYDFSKFFDSIEHEYLYRQFDQNGFNISMEERRVIEAFLRPLGRGIPQGTSISLFLANLVCWKMDKALERAGLQFARYADDTVIWAQDYQKIGKAVEIVSQFSVEAGVPINIEKSDGISVLCQADMPVEFVSRKEQISFLGYAISPVSISISEKAVNKIKRHITYILYKNLLQPIRGKKLSAVTIPANDKDKDFLSSISEIRRYLYGNLSEDMIRNYLNGSSNRIFFKGVMSFYPLVNNEQQLRELDGWLVSVIYRSVRLRRNLLKGWGYDRSHSFPFNLHKCDFKDALAASEINGQKLFKIPSFLNISKALKKGVGEYGIDWIMNPKSNQYSY